MVKATWTKINGPDLLRSSHSVSVIDEKVYIFGGEIKPREPVSNTVHCIDIKTGEYNETKGTGDIPQARVGHTAATINGEIYVFGGRGGAAMTPLEESGAIHIFNPKTSTWRMVNPSSTDYPAARSYHCSTATSDTILIHAGCGNADVGRLNDLWSLDISTKAWTKLADAPGDPRGGSAITFDKQSNRLWRFGGFNGKTEVGGVIDHIELENGNLQEARWASTDFGSSNAKAASPGDRSVTGLHALADGRLITFFGEGKPSPTGGHDAAGNFWGDVWIFDDKSKTWVEVEQQGETPGERGWFGSDAYGNGVVVWAGINKDNDRIPDGWALKLE